jgi:dienelactone hydrolase
MRHCGRIWTTCNLALFVLTGVAWGDGPSAVTSGMVEFVPTDAEAAVAERFRQTRHSFPWEARRLSAVSANFEVYDVTFPSPVKTPVDVNNTVHCEYYKPLKPGPRPAVIVLHILGGDFPLSRLFCNSLAQHGVAAMFLKMPYYGPRRDPKSPVRMVSTDPKATVEGLTQAVLDIRRGTAWLAAQPEIDAQQLGIFGISLGGITSCLASTAEPRLTNVCMLLAGGDVGQVAWETLKVRGIDEKWLSGGGTREQFVELMREIDPVTYAARAHGKRILMLNATHDEVIPKACTEALWKALGQPEIQYYSGGHYSVIRHLFSALTRVSLFFAKADIAQPAVAAP